MAAYRKCINYISEILDYAGYSIGYNVCMVGDVGVRKFTQHCLWKKHGLKFRRVSAYLDFCGFETTIIDLFGKKGLRFDLGVPIEDESLLGAFDIVISYATVEHIENQYELFRNIHNLCRDGGMVILNCPLVGTYKKHGTWTYDFDFFRDLFVACGYKPLDVRTTSLKYNIVPRNYVVMYVSYIKSKGSKFVDRENFKLPYYDPVGHKRDKITYAGCERSE